LSGTARRSTRNGSRKGLGPAINSTIHEIANAPTVTAAVVASRNVKTSSYSRREGSSSRRIRNTSVPHWATRPRKVASAAGPA
jgi:hypothetical protein